ncbi:MAG: Arm DNA-binding domain-containing protein [bacterium]
MKGKASFHMYFYIRKNREDDKGVANIYLRLSVGGEQITVSISRRVKSTSWDDKRGYVKPQAKEAAEINQYIELLRSKAYDTYKTILGQGRLVTPYAISEVLWGSKQREHTLIALFDRHNKEMDLFCWHICLALFLKHLASGMRSSPNNFPNSPGLM